MPNATNAKSWHGRPARVSGRRIKTILTLSLFLGGGTFAADRTNTLKPSAAASV